MTRLKGKGRWSRSNQPRPKYIISSVTVKEWEDTHVIARAMQLTVSACLRQLVKDQLYRLSTNTYTPAPEGQVIDLNFSEVVK